MGIAICIILLACILLEGLNLFAGPSKILDKIKFKMKVFFNPKLKELIDTDYNKGNKVLGINNTVRNVILLIVLLNIITGYVNIHAKIIAFSLAVLLLLKLVIMVIQINKKK